MIELKAEVSPERLEELELGFNEQVRCPWGILERGVGKGWTLFGYFEDSQEAALAWQALRVQFPFLPEKPQESALCDADWKNAYKAFLKPWHMRGLHWIPIWQRETCACPAGEAAFYFDAGLAFGTGDHPTTRLCAARLLDFKAERGERGLERARVVDAGCGSGILAISAYLLGFRQVYGFDRDGEAVRVSRENLKNNALPESAVLFEQAGMEAGLKNRKADLILCNIQADILCLYADALLDALAPRGRLAMSGILAEELPAVEAFFRTRARLRFPQARLDARREAAWADLAVFI